MKNIFKKSQYILLFVLFFSCTNAENELYNLSKQNNTVASYNDFITQYPNSEYIEEIKDSLNNRAEDKFFTETIKVNTIEKYNEYLEKYKNGRYIKEVNSFITSANEEKELLHKKETKVKTNQKRSKYQTIKAKILTVHFGNGEPPFFCVDDISTAKEEMICIGWNPPKEGASWEYKNKIYEVVFEETKYGKELIKLTEIQNSEFKNNKISLIFDDEFLGAYQVTGSEQYWSDIIVKKIRGEIILRNSIDWLPFGNDKVKLLTNKSNNGFQYKVDFINSWKNENTIYYINFDTEKSSGNKYIEIKDKEGDVSKYYHAN